MTPHAAAPLSDLLVFLRGTFWRPWLVIGVTLAGTMLAVLTAWLMPPVYQSTARILVEHQQISDTLARSTVTASAAERLALIEQRLMTRSNLLDISHRLGLFAQDEKVALAKQVDFLRNATRIESISFNSNPRYRGPTQVSAFTISFTSGDAEQAARVANEFVDDVLAQNLAARSAHASNTHEFFQGELERLGKELGAQEAAIAAYKSRNKDHLPGSLKLRLAELAGLRQQMLYRAERISRMQTLPSKPAIADTGDATSGGMVEPVAYNPVRQGQIDLLHEKQRMSLERIGVLQEAIDRTTQVEMELSAMQRHLDLLNVQHKDALRKATEAATGEKLERAHHAERFEVIEPARVPDEPIAPKRAFIVIGGALGSLTLAVGLAGVLEWLSRILRSSSDCHRLLNMRPVVVVPKIPTRRETTAARSKRLALGILAALVIGLGVLLSPANLLNGEVFVSSLDGALRDVGSVLLAAGTN